MLDAVAPLVHILETATEAAGTALALLGNASAHMMCDRRKQILRDLNKDLLPLIEDNEAFKGAAPLLFGDSLHASAFVCVCLCVSVCVCLRRVRLQAFHRKVLFSTIFILGQMQAINTR